MTADRDGHRISRARNQRTVQLDTILNLDIELVRREVCGKGMGALEVLAGVVLDVGGGGFESFGGGRDLPGDDLHDRVFDESYGDGPGGVSFDGANDLFDHLKVGFSAWNVETANRSE